MDIRVETERWNSEGKDKKNQYNGDCDGEVDDDGDDRQWKAILGDGMVVAAEMSYRVLHRGDEYGGK